MTRPLLLGATAMLLLSACAPSAARPASAPATATETLLESAAWQPPAGQQCELSDRSSIPALSALFDSLALLRSAREIAAPGMLLLSFATDSLGMPTHLHRIETTLPDPLAEQLEDSVRRHFRGSPAHARTGARLRVDVDAGGDPRFQLGVRQFCLAVLRNRGEIQQYLTTASQGAGQAGRVVMWVFVREDGSVGSARIRSGSPSEYLDGISVGLATRMRFHPALIDRRPVPVWIEIPFSVRVR